MIVSIFFFFFSGCVCVCVSVSVREGMGLEGIRRQNYQNVQPKETRQDRPRHTDQDKTDIRRGKDREGDDQREKNPLKATGGTVLKASIQYQ